jgi:Lhr-like helicase
MKANRPRLYVDCQTLSEDERIEVIGKAVLRGRNPVAIFVETKEKAERYLAKLREKFPSLVVVDRGSPGPGNTVAVRIGPPVFGQN